MLVVIGNPRARRLDGGRIEGAGMGHAISIAAASRGADVQVVGRVGEDDAGDRVLLDVARRGIGHVAVLRVAGRATIEAPRRASVLGLEDDSAPADEPVTGPDILEAADIQLELSYLPEYRVIVV
ncbi:MAG TPA: hypothetical protein VFO05_04885, partial [Candidatus Limnocylindrales bacterium]|nr:hypothetical protein [Candidatus Limnocylindrales bacterium]